MINSPIGQNGRPTSYIAFRILRLFFSPPFPPPKPIFHPDEVAALLAADYGKTREIIKQFADMELLNELPDRTSHYRYNFTNSCKNLDLQSSFETFLIEVQQINIPIHLIWD